MRGRSRGMQGRDAEALRWWQATCAFGHTMRETSEELISNLVGTAIESIGANYDWKWYPRILRWWACETLRSWAGPCIHGVYHDWYMHHVSPREDTELRDRLVLAKLRSRASREYSEGVSLLSPSQEWFVPLEFSLTALFCFLLFLIVYVSAAPVEAGRGGGGHAGSASRFRF